MGPRCRTLTEGEGGGGGRKTCLTGGDDSCTFFCVCLPVY